MSFELSMRFHHWLSPYHTIQTRLATQVMFIWAYGELCWGDIDPSHYVNAQLTLTLEVTISNVIEKYMRASPYLEITTRGVTGPLWWKSTSQRTRNAGTNIDFLASLLLKSVKTMSIEYGSTSPILSHVHQIIWATTSDENEVFFHKYFHKLKYRIRA